MKTDDEGEPSDIPANLRIPGYEIGKRQGSGAMATVYSARQISLDRTVAIKVLSHELTSQPGYVERFYAEGRAAAKLNHPNIVTALDVGEAQGFHFFVMEYVEGRTIYGKLKQEVRLDEDDAIDVTLQVARGLQHAHEAGFIHRDVKPQNIIITAGGQVKLADLGLARGQSDTELDPAQPDEGKRKIVVGSPYYVSPEQILAGHTVDFRADIYSLGATLFYMVTGQLPFDAPLPADVLRKHIREPLPDPRRINGRLSVELCQVIRVMMAKKREDRYDSTADLVADLEALRHGEAPLKAQVKLGIDVTLELPGRRLAQDRDSRSPSVGNYADPDDETPVVRFRRPTLIQERSFWAAVAGWGAAAIMAFLYWVK